MRENNGEVYPQLLAQIAKWSRPIPLISSWWKERPQEVGCGFQALLVTTAHCWKLDAVSNRPECFWSSRTLLMFWAINSSMFYHKMESAINFNLLIHQKWVTGWRGGRYCMPSKCSLMCLFWEHSQIVSILTSSKSTLAQCSYSEVVKCHHQVARSGHKLKLLSGNHSSLDAQN